MTLSRPVVKPVTLKYENLDGDIPTPEPFPEIFLSQASSERSPSEFTLMAASASLSAFDFIEEPTKPLLETPHPANEVLLAIPSSDLEEKTPQDQLKANLSEIDAQVYLLYESEKELTFQVPPLRQEIRQLQLKEAQLIQQQSQASQSEDFDRAAVLDDDIRSVQHSLATLRGDLSHLAELSKQNQQEMHQYLQWRINVYLGGSSQLQELSRKQETAKEDAIDRIQTALALKEVRMATQKGALVEEKAKLEIEKSRLSLEKGEVHQKIDNSCTELAADRDRLISEEEALAKEIEVLEASLACKRQERKKVQESLGKVMEEIKGNAKPFQDVLRRLQATEHFIQERDVILRGSELALEELSEEIKSLSTEKEETELKMEEELQSLQHQIAICLSEVGKLNDIVQVTEQLHAECETSEMTDCEALLHR